MMAGIGAASLLAAPEASALTVTPAPDGGTLTLNQGEAKLLGDANVGPVVDAIFPTWENDSTPESLGEGLNSRADLVGRTPGAQLDITVANLPGSPEFLISAYR